MAEARDYDATQARIAGTILAAFFMREPHGPLDDENYRKRLAEIAFDCAMEIVWRARECQREIGKELGPR